MSGAPHLSDLASHPNRLIRQLGTRGDLRPGSLVVNHRRCGQSSCCRADKKRRRHGRYWLLTVKGEPRSRSIPAVQVTETKAQITSASACDVWGRNQWTNGYQRRSVPVPDQARQQRRNEIARAGGRGRNLPKALESTLGPMTIQRAYCHYPDWQNGFVPGDGPLGTQRTGLSRAWHRMQLENRS